MIRWKSYLISMYSCLISTSKSSFLAYSIKRIFQYACTVSKSRFLVTKALPLSAISAAVSE